MIYIYIWSIENSILYLLFQFYFHFYIFLPRMLSIVTYFLPCFYEKRNWYTYYEQISTLRKFHVQINVYFQHLIQLSFQFSLLLFLFLLVTHLLSIYTSYYGYEKNNKYLSKKATRMRIIENQPCRKSILARVESTNILRRSDFSQPLYSERKRERAWLHVDTRDWFLVNYARHIISIV